MTTLDPGLGITDVEDTLTELAHHVTDTAAGRGCTVPDCPRRHYGRGLCQAHWARWRRTGDTGPAPALADLGRDCDLFIADATSFDQRHGPDDGPDSDGTAPAGHRSRTRCASRPKK